MKKSDLYREWARVLDMCEGTNINPWQCVRQPRTKELHRTDRMPDFSMRPEDYEFAVAILEDKPVFVGDKIYSIRSRSWVTVQPEDAFANISPVIRGYSWEEPKTTFNLNGEKLPCPDMSNRYELRVVGFNDNVYHFANGTDIRQVECAINRLLQDATK